MASILPFRAGYNLDDPQNPVHIEKPKIPNPFRLRNIQGFGVTLVGNKQVHTRAMVDEFGKQLYSNKDKLAFYKVAMNAIRNGEYSSVMCILEEQPAILFFARPSLIKTRENIILIGCVEVAL